MDKAVHHTIRYVLAHSWYLRNSHQRRAITFIVIFALLLVVWIASSDSTTSGATLIYQQLREPSWTQLVADVPSFHILAVADNDDNNLELQSFRGKAASRRRGAPSNGTTTATSPPPLRRTSSLAQGILTISVNPATGRTSFRVEWTGISVLQSGFMHDGRGLELSTLQYWGGTRLLSCDDHTGIVYEIVLEEGLQPRLVPRHILSDGDGKADRGMRCEWCTTKGDTLMIGSTGNPWVHETTGSILNHHPLWVKTISPLGVVNHIDWTVPYERMRDALGIGDQGYMIHECSLWSSKWNRWYFIPRHVSNTPYRPGDEHLHGSTVIIIADSRFQNIVVNTLQSSSSTSPSSTSSSSSTWNPTMGVTDCKFIPNGRDREIMIIRTVEPASTLVMNKNKQQSSREKQHSGKKQQQDGRTGNADGSAGYLSYVSIINTDGAILMEDRPMPANWKFEGLELRPMLHAES